MLDKLESQVLRATIADLSSRVAPALQDPAAAATLSMANRLLAHLLARGESSPFATLDAEVAVLQAEEAREDALLAAGGSNAAGEGISAESLTAYIATRLDGATVTAIEASLGGFSKRTLLLRLSGAPQLDNGLVIRCDECGGPVDSAAADELPILRLMHRHGVPVAAPLWADHGFPFGGTALCTRRIAGSSAYDASGSALGPQGPQAARELARVLARVHAVPVAELEPSPDLQAASLQQHVERMVSRFQSQWQRHRVRPSPVLDAALDYLLSNIPQAAGLPVIVHGDASLRNLLLHEGRASGLVDWELWHLGDPNEDLAYCRPEVEQVMPWEDFVAAYRAQGGMAWCPQAGAYYGLFGAVRNAVFGASIIHGFLRAEQPAMRFAFAAAYLARKLIPEVARRLTALKSGAEAAHVE